MSRIISPGARQDYARWEYPDVGTNQPHNSSSGGGALSTSVTASQLEKIQAQAYEEGFSLGKNEGIEKGREIISAQVENIESICNLLNAPLQDLDKQVIEELTDLALIVAQHLIRREISVDPGQVVAVIQQAMSELPVSSRNIKLYLHPEDSTLVSNMLENKNDTVNWEILSDPLLSRGGCRVATETSHIDASIEKRLAQIVAELLGGEREQDHANE